MGFFDYFDPCKTTDTNATDAGVPFSTEPHPFCFDDAGMPSCLDDSSFGLDCKIHPFSRWRTNFPREPLLKRGRGIKNADLWQSID